jgi:hypothetical protein
MANSTPQTNDKIQEMMDGATPDYLKPIQKIIILEEQPDEIHTIVRHET